MSYTVLNPGPNTFLGKALKGGTDTRLNVGSITLASAASHQGMAGMDRNLTLHVWWRWGAGCL